MTNEFAMPDLSALAGRRILVACTAALTTAFLPTWLGWLQQTTPRTTYRVIITPAARRFVGTTAAANFLGEDLLIDQWDETSTTPTHVEFASWADGYLVHPATMDFVSRFSAGLCDSPLLLALQGTSKPVVLGAAAPPGFTQGAAWPRYVESIDSRGHAKLLPPMEGISAANPDQPGSPPQLFPHALGELASMLQDREEAPGEHD